MNSNLKRSKISLFILIIATLFLLWSSVGASQAYVTSSALAQTTSFPYTYERLPTGSVCGTTGPSPNQVEIQVLRKNSGTTIEIEVRKCDGSEFRLGGNYELRIDNNLYERRSYPGGILEIQLPLDPVKLSTPRLGFHDYQVYVYSSDQPTTAKHTGIVRVWEVYTRPTDVQTDLIYDIQPYRTRQCGNIVGLELVQSSSPNMLEAAITKCSGASTFQNAGYLYLEVDGQPFLGPVRYLSGQASISQQFDPADYGLASQRRNYRAVIYSDDQPTLREKITGQVSALGQIPTGDQYEPDNDFTQAKSIDINGNSQNHTIHTPGDEDWMKFDAIVGNEYTIETFDLQGGTDTVLGLFWDDQNDNHPDLLMKDDNPGPSLLVWTADQNATRWIKVRDTNTNLGGTTVSYKVKVTMKVSQGDQYESDNDFMQSKSIDVNSNQFHTFHQPGDEDWIKFEAQAGYKYLIETFDLQGIADTYIGLFWDNNNDNHADLIKVDDNSGGGSASQIQWTAPRTGTHYVKIRDVNRDTGGAGIAYGVRINMDQSIAYNTSFLTDAQLENYLSMSEAQVRQFLINSGSYFRQSVEDYDGQIFDLSQVIEQVAVQYKINPQVLLVTLEKEQSAITRETRPSDSQMRHLMGCLKPSTARQQIACAAERFRSYHDDLNSRGQTVSGWKVDGAKSTEDGVLVTPATKAIAGQFTYTPYAGPQWGGNQSRWGGVYLFYAIWHQFGFDETKSIDTTRPTARITAPIQNSTLSKTLLTIEVEATDESGGSGIQRIDFHASYNGGSYYLGTDESFPYSFDWKLPQGLRSQGIMLVPHAFDHAGNRSNLVEGYVVVNFIASQVNPEVTEHWVAVSNRFYLNQNALGMNGRAMCSMASIAMIRASAGLISSDTDNMVQEANRVWNELRGPAPGGVAKYLSNNGMNATVIWTQDKNAHWQKIKDEINNNRPVILNSHSNGGNLTISGHYIVVVGYQENSASSDRQLIVYDPFGKWKGAKGEYDKNGETHSDTVGMWVFYRFDELGTIYSITASRQTGSTAAAHADNMSSPDVISVRDFEDIVTYEGHNQLSNDVFLPVIIR